MFLEKISWVQAQEYFEKKDIAIIPVGSTENHGSQLCLGTDFIIPRKLCEMMDERLDVLVVPTIPYGVGDQHSNFPGTITIGADGLYDLVTRIVNELYRFGIRKFVFLNGHGGNTPVLQRVCVDLDNKHALGALLNWWTIAGDLNPQWKGGHGGAEETAAMLAIDPSCVHMHYFKEFHPKDLSAELKFDGATNVSFKGVSIPVPRHVDRWAEYGWYGPDSPHLATVNWGNKMLSETADFCADFIEAFEKVEIPMGTEPKYNFDEDDED